MRTFACIVAVVASLSVLATGSASARALTGPGDAASQGSYDASTAFQVNG